MFLFRSVLKFGSSLHKRRGPLRVGKNSIRTPLGACFPHFRCLSDISLPRDLHNAFVVSLSGPRRVFSTTRSKRFKNANVPDPYFRIIQRLYNVGNTNAQQRRPRVREKYRTKIKNNERPYRMMIKNILVSSVRTLLLFAENSCVTLLHNNNYYRTAMAHGGSRRRGQNADKDVWHRIISVTK